MPKTNYNDTWVKLGSIHNAILESNERANLWFTQHSADQWPHWYMDLLTRIHAFARDADVTYLSSSLDQEPTPGGRVLAFTDQLVIEVELVEFNAETGAGRVAASAWRRSELDQVSILRMDPYPTRERIKEIQFPGWTRIELRYRGRDVIQLPLLESPGRPGLEALSEAYGSFVDDIAQSPGNS